jgi:hypothetical protein
MTTATFFHMMLVAFIASCIYLYADAVIYSRNNKDTDK